MPALLIVFKKGFGEAQSSFTLHRYIEISIDPPTVCVSGQLVLPSPWINVLYFAWRQLSAATVNSTAGSPDAPVNFEKQADSIIQNFDQSPSININSGHQNSNTISNIEEDNIEDTEEFVEESLSLKDKEIELIKKALEKHNGKRKYAAKDLGISERTLYRKIKEYDIN